MKNICKTFIYASLFLGLVNCKRSSGQGAAPDTSVYMYYSYIDETERLDISLDMYRNEEVWAFVSNGSGCRKQKLIRPETFNNILTIFDGLTKRNADGIASLPTASTAVPTFMYGPSVSISISRNFEEMNSYVFEQPEPFFHALMENLAADVLATGDCESLASPTM